MQQLTRRQALGGAISLAALALLGDRPATAQAVRPQFLMFHVEAGW